MQQTEYVALCGEFFVAVQCVDNSIIMDGTPRLQPRRHHCYSESMSNINVVLIL